MAVCRCCCHCRCRQPPGEQKITASVLTSYFASLTFGEKGGIGCQRPNHVQYLLLTRFEKAGCFGDEDEDEAGDQAKAKAERRCRIVCFLSSCPYAWGPAETTHPLILGAGEKKSINTHVAKYRIAAGEEVFI